MVPIVHVLALLRAGGQSPYLSCNRGILIKTVHVPHPGADELKEDNANINHQIR